MRVMHVISSLKRGGAEKLLYEHICHLNQVEHNVLYFHDGPYSALLAQKNINSKKISGLICLYDPIFWWRLIREINKDRPQLIHSWLWSANVSSSIIGWLFNIPVIISLHNNVEQNGWLRTLIDIATLNCANRVVCVSHGIYENLPFIYKYHSKKISVIKNGIRLHASTKTIKRSTIGIEESDFVIGSVGRLVKIKNYPLLIKAFGLLVALYPHARLVLLGVGPEEQSLKQLVHQLNIQDKVIFVINQPAYDYYDLFDCFCLTSYKEGISIALLEALCHEVCCIVTCTAPHHDVIQHEYNGIIVNSYESYAVFEALKRLMNNKPLRNALAAQGKKTLNNNFSLKRMSAEYVALYAQYITPN